MVLDLDDDAMKLGSDGPGAESDGPSSQPTVLPAVQSFAKQTQAFIASTSLQLQNDRRQMRQPLYYQQQQQQQQPGAGMRVTVPPSSAGSLNPAAANAQSSTSPVSSIGRLWAAGQQAGLLQYQSGMTCLVSPSPSATQAVSNSAAPSASSSFADFFAARRGSQSDANSTPMRTPAERVVSAIHGLAEDVRATAAAAAAAGRCGSAISRSSSRAALVQEMRRRHVDGQQQQGLYKSHSSVASMAAMAGGNDNGCNSVGELSLWSEPLNVSPASPQRRPASAQRWPQAEQRDSRPQSPTVLAMFATSRNVAPALATNASDSCCSEGSPYNVAHAQRQASPEQRGRSCSPTAYRAAGADEGCRSRSCSPPVKHLICCGCRRQHTLQQHSKCCHLCGTCCKVRGACGTAAAAKAGGGLGSMGVGVTAGRVAPADAIAAECSGASSTSTCPCVKAYKKGHRDAMQQMGVEAAAPASVSATQTAHQQPLQQRQQHLDQQHEQLRRSGRSFPDGGYDNMPLQSAVHTPAAVGLCPESQGGAHTANNAHQPSAGGTVVSEPSHSAATGGASPGVSAAGADSAQQQEDLVLSAFLEVRAAQHNLLAQGPAADPLDVEELTQILQQVLPAAEPQHEQLLKEVLGRQQELLAAQQERMAALEQEEEQQAQWTQQLPPLKLPSGLGRHSKGAAAGSVAGSAAAGAASQPREDYEGFSTRTNSTSSDHSSRRAMSHVPPHHQQQQQPSCSGGHSPTSRTAAQQHQHQPTVFVTPADLAATMTNEDRLAAAAAAHEAFENVQKPLKQQLEATRGMAGSRSSRVRGTSAPSSMATAAGHQVVGSAGMGHASCGGRPAGSPTAHSKNKHAGAPFEAGAAPAYTADGGCELVGPEDSSSKPLVYFMTTNSSHRGGDSRHVVQDSHEEQVTFVTTTSQQGNPPMYSRTNSSRAPISAQTAGRNSNRSIADSAWSVQAPVRASGMHGTPCSMMTHVASGDQAASVSRTGSTHQPAAGLATIQGGGSETGSDRSASTNSSNRPHSTAAGGGGSNQAPVVPPLNLGASTATFAGGAAAVDSRVMSLSPRLRDAVAAGSLQALADAISEPDRHISNGSSGTGVSSASMCMQGSPAFAHWQQAPSPATPRVDQSRSAGGPGSMQNPPLSQQHTAGMLDGSTGCSSAHSSHRGGMQGNNCPQQYACSNSSQPGGVSRGSSFAGHDQHQQQQWLAMQQQEQHMRPSMRKSSRAVSFEPPDSAPSSYRPSCDSTSIDALMDSAMPSQEPSTYAVAAGGLSKASTAGGAGTTTAAAGVTAARALSDRQSQQSTSREPQEQHSPKAVMLHNLAMQHSSSSLASAGGLAEAARASALAAKGSFRQQSVQSSVPSPMSPQRMQSPFSPQSSRVSLVSAAAAAAAAVAVAVSPSGTASFRAASTGMLDPRGIPSPRNTDPTGDSFRQSAQSAQAMLGAAPMQSPFSPQASTVAAHSDAAGPHSPLASIEPPRPAVSMNGLQPGPTGAVASSAADSAWRERQVAMQEQLVAQAQQFARLRSRTSSVATTPGAASMLRSMSRASWRSSPLASPTRAGQPATGFFQPQQQAPQQQAPQQQQQQQADSVADTAVSDDGESEAGSEQHAAQLQGALNTILCDRLRRRRRARVLKKSLQEWRVCATGRHARTAGHAPRRRSSNSSSVEAADGAEKGPGCTHCGSNSAARPGTDSSLRISVQGLSGSMLQQSLNLLQSGQHQLAAAQQGADALEIVVSGQLCLAPSPTGRQRAPPLSNIRTAFPERRQQQAGEKAPDCSSAGGNSVSSNVILHFEKQLEATKAAVAAAEARAGRPGVPLQGVLRDMQSMVARMEAACGSAGGGVQDPSTAVGTHSPPPRGDAALRRSVQHQAKQMPSPQRCRSPRRPGTASAVADGWNQQQHQQAAVSTSQPCSPAFSQRNRNSPFSSPHADSKFTRSPDRHKLRGRLHLVQDRLAKLEVKMNQAASMAEPCTCGAGGGSSGGIRQSASWGQGYFTPSEGSCCCSLRHKRDVLVGNMQKDLENLQDELQQLQQAMPRIYSGAGV